MNQTFVAKAILPEEKKKGVVFCHMCNQIVGDSFPVDHYHKDWGNGSGVIWMLQNNLKGFGYYVDTPELRERLAKECPPRTKIEIEI